MNLPVLVTYPEFLLIRAILSRTGLSKSWYFYIPELGEWYRYGKKFTKALNSIGLTEQMWYNRWILNKEYSYKGPKCINDKCSNYSGFYSAKVGYRAACCPACHNAFISRNELIIKKRLESQEDYLRSGGSIRRILDNPDLYPDSYKKLTDWYKSGGTFGKMNKSPEKYPKYLPYSTSEWCSRISNLYYDNIGNSNISIGGNYRYVSGRINSLKSDRSHYRSSWEGILMSKFEDDPYVKTYRSEPFSIKYTGSDGSIHRYVPDILVEFQDGSRSLIEIKPETFLGDENVKLKLQAGKSYCEENGMDFVVLTWNELKLVSVYLDEL